MCFLSSLVVNTYAAEPRQEPTEKERARTVYIFHQPIVMLQAKFGLTTPEERVLRIRNTLRNFTEADVREPLQVVSVTRYNQPGRLIVMNGKPVMLLTQGDLDEGDDLTLDQAAQRVLARMEAQRSALSDQYNSGWLALSAVKTVAGLVGLVLFWFGAYRSWRWVRRVYRRRIFENKSWIPQSWRRFIGAIETRLYALLMILLGIVALYVWLSGAFSLFPWTRVWGESLGDWSVRVVRDIALSIVSALPGLMIVLIIFLITAFILKLLKVVLNQVEAGRLQLPGIHPETVGATRKLISVVVWLFALSAAYPFLPGANSLAFKGISVFFGLMLTLGSAGVMNHAMSGLVLIYSRALRKGDILQENPYGFLPIPLVITEPAVGYGGGLFGLFLHGKGRQVDGQFIPPAMSAFGGGGTQNGTFRELDGDWWNSKRRVPDKFLVLKRNYNLEHNRLPTPVSYENATPLQLTFPAVIEGYQLARLGELQIYPGTSMQSLPRPKTYYAPDSFQSLADTASEADKIQLERMHKSRF